MNIISSSADEIKACTCMYISHLDPKLCSYVTNCSLNTLKRNQQTEKKQDMYSTGNFY